MAMIDRNADLGAGFGPQDMSDDAAMMSIVASANVACGGYASDPEPSFRTPRQAKINGVNPGAHPGFNDREGFGRRVIPMTPAKIGPMCAAQIGTLTGIAALVDVPVTYVKPHGPLGNKTARDRQVADTTVASERKIDPILLIPAISGTESERAINAAGHLIAFMDSGPMHVLDGDPIELTAGSICVHGDNAGAVALARDIRDSLTSHGITTSSFSHGQG